MSTIELAAVAGVVAITLSIAGVGRYLAARRSGKSIDIAGYLVRLGSLLAVGLLVVALLTDVIGSQVVTVVVLLVGAAVTTILALLLPRRPWAGDLAARGRLVRVFWLLSLVQVGAAIALGQRLITLR
jgi:uncharacterized membrane protein